MSVPLFTRVLARVGHRRSIAVCADADSVRRAVLQRARRAVRSGDTDVARALLDECDGVQRDAAALNVLGLAAEADGDLDAARVLWNRSLERDPCCTAAVTNLTRLVIAAHEDDDRAFGDEPRRQLNNREVRR